MCVSAQTRTEKDSMSMTEVRRKLSVKARTIVPPPYQMASKGEDGGRYQYPEVVAAGSFIPRFVQAYS